MAHSVNLDDDALLLLDGRCDTRTQTLIDQVKAQRIFTERHAALRSVTRPVDANDIVELRHWTLTLEAALVEAHEVIGRAAASGDDTTPVDWLLEVKTTVETLLGFGPEGPEALPADPA
jgi:hypothetical protein